MGQWGWLLAFEAFFMFGLVFWWGWRELRALARVRRDPDRGPPGLP